MHRCVLMILFVLSLIFETHSAIPYSCNAMRLNADIATSIGVSLNNNDFFQDLADLEYEKKAAAEKSKRKSWDDAQHVKNVRSASREFSVESMVANATLMRYEFEQWKERNPAAYEAFLKSVDEYNSAALTKSAAQALVEAIPTKGGSLLKFALGVSLFAGAEYVAGLISDYGADKVARYCAGGDMIKFASYLKTCEFFFNFISEHGIIGGLKRKLATASANTHQHPHIEKPIANERRATGTTAKSDVKTSQNSGAKTERKGPITRDERNVNIQSVKQYLKNNGFTQKGEFWFKDGKKYNIDKVHGDHYHLLDDKTNRKIKDIYLPDDVRGEK